MKTPNKTEEKKQTRKAITVDSFEITRALVTKSEAVTFDIIINGIAIYGCWVKVNKNGEDFISFPQRKGQDKEGHDKYYHIAYAALSEEDQKAILEEVENKINS